MALALIIAFATAGCGRFHFQYLGGDDLDASSSEAGSRDGARIDDGGIEGGGTEDATVDAGAAASCSDGLRNQDETDVDCGGVCGATCLHGEGCMDGRDCSSDLCIDGFCRDPRCENGMRDGAETDVDCGGDTCAPCADGQGCNLDRDCSSVSCPVSTCTRDTLRVEAAWSGLAAGTVVAGGRVVGLTGFATVTDAMAVVTTGMTIEVGAGTYRENVRLNVAGITVRGESGAIIDGDVNRDGLPDASDTVAVTAGGITVLGIEVTGCRNGFLITADDATIRRCAAHGCLNTNPPGGVGILAWGDMDRLQILDNEIFENDRMGIYVGDLGTGGTSTDNRITNNEIYDNGLYRNAGSTNDEIGITVSHTERTLISGNHIHDHADVSDVNAGIWVDRSSNLQVEDNDLHDNVNGIEVNRSTGVTISGNLVEKNGTGLLIGTTAPVGVNAGGNDFCGNSSFGARNASATPVGVTGSHWGSIDGPSPVGSGDRIQGSLDASGYVAAPLGAAGCRR